MNDVVPAVWRIARLDWFLIPAGIVVDVMAMLAKGIELLHPFNFLVLSFVGRRLEGIHELEQGGLPIFIVDVLAPGSMTAFAANILQVGSCRLVSIAGVVFESRHMTDHALSIELP